MEKEVLDRIEDLLHKQRMHKAVMLNLSAKDRIQRIKRIRKAMWDYRSQIQEALYKDFKKAELEVDMTEIYVVISEANNAIKNVKKWMRPQRVPTPINMIGTTSSILYEPKGNVLIISPWNFPINLVFGPLVSAIAAGNTVIIKPSEYTTNTSKLTREIIEAIFDENEVAVVNGGVDVSTELLKNRFDHIFFTGSPKVGKIVMKAAAEHLSSVTLELGGKSPTIIDESANLKVAAKRIVAGKFANSSQACISHDYIFVHRSKSSEFISLIKDRIIHSYGEEASESSDYCRIIDEKNTKRLANYIQEVKIADPESIVYGGLSNIEDCYISPTMILNPDRSSSLMKDEIFGPILPILEYDTIDEVIAYINSEEKPLALYIFSKNAKNINKVRNHTSSGSMNINETAIHYYHLGLPFGGVNNSGMGKAHGLFGFKSFSNEKGILKQHLNVSPIELIFPPFTKMSKFWVDLFLKYF